MRDIETIDSELRLVAVLRQAAWEWGGPLPSIDVADALLDECVALPSNREGAARSPRENADSYCRDRRQIGN
jgi:hypothetical protein